MSKFTLYRADVDSPRLARVLGTVPGIAVGDEGTDDRGVGAEPAPDESDDGGLEERVPLPETDVDASVVKTYGLLGLGVSMVMLGIATVGIWVYRRRNGDSGESETPPPTTGVDTDGTAPPAGETERAASEPEPSTPEPSLVIPDEEPASETAPHGRTEGDRSDVEWEPRETSEPEPVETPDEPAEPKTVEDDARPTESVDAAPLLGLAFLAASGAVVQWLQGGDEV
ncbi:hypothetical protein [Haloarcula sediminis]|uniref:hypothetical protein n=1 Tax=Haloarcula sediminis TaxID=3111777 RepID=UPI002D76BCFE|nr:hypothetical protein [Haloarcula sp. CK38]